MVMEPIVVRLHQFIDYKRLNSHLLALELGYDSSEKISRLFRKEGAKPSYDIILDIANKFEELNIEWLINGKGSMIKNAAFPLNSQVLEEPRAEYASGGGDELDTILLYINRIKSMSEHVETLVNAMKSEQSQSDVKLGQKSDKSTKKRKNRNM